jgi:hypothetical protein
MDDFTLPWDLEPFWSLIYTPHILIFGKKTSCFEESCSDDSFELFVVLIAVVHGLKIFTGGGRYIH